MKKTKTVSVYEAFDIISGGTPKKNVKEYWNGDINWISVEDFSSISKYIEDTKEFITKEGYENSNTNFLECNDIIISARGTVGKLNMIKRPMCFNQSCYGLRAKDMIDSNYGYYALVSVINNIKKRSYGSVFSTITTDSFKTIELPIFELNRQESIAGILSLIDEKIDNNTSIIKKLKKLGQLVYDYWFLQFDFPDENGQPYKSSGGKMKFSKELNREIPEGWSAVPLLQLVKWESNSQPPKSEFIYQPKEGYIRFIQNRDYDSDNFKTYIPIKSNLKTVDRYDILMDKYGDAGRVRYGIEGAFNVALGKITVKNIQYREYVRSFLETKSIYKYLNNSSIASTRSSLNESNLSLLKIVKPDSNILEQYNQLLIKTKEIIFNSKDENQELNKLKNWLLPMLMNGQVKINDK